MSDMEFKRQEDINNLKSIPLLKQQVEFLSCNISELKDYLKTNFSNIEEKLEKIETLRERISLLEYSYEETTNKIENMKEGIINKFNTASTITKAETLKREEEDKLLNTKIDNFKNDINSLILNQTNKIMYVLLGLVISILLSILFK